MSKQPIPDPMPTKMIREADGREGLQPMHHCMPACLTDEVQRVIRVPKGVPGASA